MPAVYGPPRCDSYGTGKGLETYPPRKVPSRLLGRLTNRQDDCQRGSGVLRFNKSHTTANAESKQ